MFERLNDEGRTIIMVTHEDDVAAHAKRIIRLRDGLLQSDQPNEHRVSAAAADAGSRPRTARRRSQVAVEVQAEQST